MGGRPLILPLHFGSGGPTLSAWARPLPGLCPPKPLHQWAQNPLPPGFSPQASAAFLQASGRGDGPPGPRLSPRALRLQNQLQLHRQVPSPADRPEGELPGEAGSRRRRGLVGGTSNGGQAGPVSPPSLLDPRRAVTGVPVVMKEEIDLRMEATGQTRPLDGPHSFPRACFHLIYLYLHAPH